MRSFLIALALGLGAGQVEAQTRLPHIQVTPQFVDGVHRSCDIRFVLRMGVEQGFFDNEIASGTVSLWSEDSDLVVFLKLGFVGEGTVPPPDSSYLIRGYETNAAELVSSDLTNEGKWRLSMFYSEPITLQTLLSIGVDEPRVTVGFKTADQGVARQFGFDLTRQQAETWEECRHALTTRWLERVDTPSE